MKQATRIVRARRHGRGGFVLLQQKFGYRFDRHADMDVLEAPEPEQRDERLRAAVDDLPEEVQIVISRLFFGADHQSVRQIAKELGISVDKAKERMNLGLEALRDVLGSD